MHADNKSGKQVHTTQYGVGFERMEAEGLRSRARKPWSLGGGGVLIHLLLWP